MEQIIDSAAERMSIKTAPKVNGLDRSGPSDEAFFGYRTYSSRSRWCRVARIFGCSEETSDELGYSSVIALQATCARRSRWFRLLGFLSSLVRSGGYIWAPHAPSTSSFSFSTLCFGRFFALPPLLLIWLLLLDVSPTECCLDRRGC